ncbi:MAG TPA: response regulator [Synergistales bacterium]|nr:response regulator [Synergistales bacterium]
MIILSIDDKKDNLVTLEAVLGDLLPKASVISVQNGLKGIEQARRMKPDVILLDLRMPVIDGYEVTRKLRDIRETKSIPIIALTALDTSTENKVKALDAGVDAFLVKPLDETELIAQLRAMFRLRESEAMLQKERDILEDKVRERTRELEMSSDALERALEETVYVLAKTVESKDPYNSGHQRRVAELGERIATRLGLDEFVRKSVFMAGMIHDIGKIQVPSEILSKPGKISAAEFDIIRQHPEAGYTILKPVHFPWPVADIVLQHHERIDGSGYPRGLKDGNIMIEARILSVTDVVEAMSSHRPYRPSLGIDQALEEIRQGSGTLYDPDVVAVCLELFENEGFEFPEEVSF